jgi:hypothetical protein
MLHIFPRLLLGVALAGSLGLAANGTLAARAAPIPIYHFNPCTFAFAPSISVTGNGEVVTGNCFTPGGLVWVQGIDDYTGQVDFDGYTTAFNQPICFGGCNGTGVIWYHSNFSCPTSAGRWFGSVTVSAYDYQWGRWSNSVGFSYNCDEIQ